MFIFKIGQKDTDTKTHRQIDREINEQTDKYHLRSNACSWIQFEWKMAGVMSSAPTALAAIFYCQAHPVIWLQAQTMDSIFPLIAVLVVSRYRFSDSNTGLDIFRLWFKLCEWITFCRWRKQECPVETTGDGWWKRKTNPELFPGVDVPTSHKARNC